MHMNINTLRKLTFFTFILAGLQLSGCSSENGTDNSGNKAPEFIDFNNVSVVNGSTNVATLKALDPEDDPLTFDIYGGDDADLFDIEPSTGAISFISPPNVATPLDADRNNIFIIEVSVSDNTSTVIRDIEITLADPSSNQAPYFVSLSTITATPGSITIGTLVANDPNNDTLNYSISAGADAALISINPSSGDLSFKAIPDAITPGDANQDNIYSIEVSVSDGLSVTKQNFEISLGINSPSNASPIFVSGSDIKTSDNSQNVTTIIAQDSDSNILDFSITGGADASFFSLNPQSGVLDFTSLPNASTPSDTNQDNIYEIEIGVSDGNTRTIQIFSITVLKAIDNTLYNAADALRGGRLYDKWWNVKNTATPTDNNPIWDAVIAQFPDNQNGKNGGQWRCKECHGWDYKGSDGAYSQGSSHYTGIKGLNNTNVLEVFNAIENGIVTFGSTQNIPHSFIANNKLNTSDVYDLTKFIVEIASTNTANPSLGDAVRGKTVFDQVPIPNPTSWSCDSGGCHTNTSSTSLSKIIEVAKENPQEFLHKVRFGAPIGSMPFGMNVSDAQDVYAYVATGAGSTNTGNSNFDPSYYASINRDAVVDGGRFYDKWWKRAANSTEPTTTHSRWPATNSAISGSSTWRCKECHGWDYRGADGAYASGKHATGFPGIVNTSNFTMKRLDAASVYTFLKEDANHGFNNGLFTDPEYYAITKFVMTMRDEVSVGLSSFNFVDDNTKLANNGANANSGKFLYETANTISCSNSSCHGVNGKRIDFKDGDPTTIPNTFLHNIAQENPWEFIHKARFSDAAAFMPNLYAANDSSINSINAVADILAYAQSDLVPDIKRAGRLYDKWWNVDGILDANVPNTRNQTWVNNAGTTDATIVSDSSTWRCKECHGWDYQGVDGKYGYNGDTTGKHYSGILGFIPTLNTPAKDKAYIFGAIKNGVAGSQLVDHDFGRFLNDKDINLLVEFITDENEGVPKLVTTYDVYLSNGAISQGKTTYESNTPGNCASCHGINGTSIPTVDMSAVANGNPQEFLHKVRYGHPGSSMLPTSSGFVGLDLPSASNVLAYSKTLNSGTNPNPTYNYATADIVRGGRLYDKWWKEMQAADSTVQAPVDYNPYWAGRSANLPDFPASYSETKKIETSWRCKSCHAWDYKGTGYETGTPSTNGADNLIYKIELRRLNTFQNDETALQQHIYDWIKSGLGTSHQFGSVTTQNPSAMDDRELWDLTKFLLEGGIIDSDSSILNSGIVIGTNNTNGGGLYNGSIDADVNCVICHGANGDIPPPVDQGGSGEALDIFQISSASENPWEFVHKTRFGQPGSSMPGIFGVNNLTDKDAFDILGYSQQQFNSR